MNNNKYDYVIEEGIFTEEQRDFMRRNNDALFKYKKEREVAEREITDWEERNKKVHFLIEQEDFARYNLEPFIEKSKEYYRKKNEIMKANGLNADDFPNEKVIREITYVINNMREESSKYTEDLRYNLESKRNLEAMFNTNSSKNDLNSMFEDKNDEKANDLAKRFK